MRFAVIGAGVVGVASAYMLARRGHAVTLLDAASAPGLGASAGNAAQLSWAYGDAMASPALLKHLPAIAAGRDPAFRIRWRLDPDFLLWGLRFLANASHARWWSNTKGILALADESRRELATLLSELDLAFDYRIAGKLHLHASASGLEAAREGVARKRNLGIEQSVIPRAAAEEIEPALRTYGGEIAGAVWTPGDALGDAAAFCRNLAAHLVSRYGVEARFGAKVAGFERSAGRLGAVRLADREPLAVDAAVVTAGTLSRAFAADLPEARAIQPVRGYSLTVPWRIGMPRVSLTDVRRKLAFATIGERFRAAGLADIDRPGAGFDPARFEALREAAHAALPDCFDAFSKDGIRWSGERPMTPSSRPVIAPSRRLPGLYLNAGHGMLGWTLALGSARRLCSLIEG